MKLLDLVWPFVPLARLGWATASHPNPEPQSARGRVFLLRGNGAVFSRGFGRLCDRFRAAGFRAEDLRCTGDSAACCELLAARERGELSGPVVFVGHSRGGRRTLAAAQRLEPAGVVVDLLVCVDVAFPPPAPGNVRHAVHLYRSRLRLYPARPLRAAPGSSAVIENINLDGPDPPFPGRGLHHLNITASEAVHDWIIRCVGEVIGAD